MGLASEIMGGGFSAGQARAINGQNTSTFSCAGTTVADAALIKTSNTIISTCASGAGAILPAVPPGDEVVVYNSVVGNAAIIYPDTGAKINQLAANVGMNLGSFTGVKLYRLSTTQWIGFLSA